MSDKKPTYKELSLFGQCVVDRHYDTTLGKLTQPQPGETAAQKKTREKIAAGIAPKGLESPEAQKDHILDTVGIDGILDMRADELGSYCADKLPTPKPLNLRKAARTLRV